MNNVPTQCQQDRINMIETRRNIHMANYIVQREREREREGEREIHIVFFPYTCTKKDKSVSIIIFKEKIFFKK